MKAQFDIAISGLTRGLKASAVILPIIAITSYAQGMKEECDRRGYATSYCMEIAPSALSATIKDIFAPDAGTYLTKRTPSPREKSIRITSATLDMG